MKLLQEHDDHFIVDDGKGPLKIAKLHLHHGTVQRIRQHFADGGEVQPEGHKGVALLGDDSMQSPPRQPSGNGSTFGSKYDWLAQSRGIDPQIAANFAAATGSTPPGYAPSTETQAPDGIAAPPPAAIAAPPAQPDFLNAPQTQDTPAAPAPQPAAPAFKMPGISPDFAGGAKQEQAGINSRAQAVQAEGSAAAGIADNLAQQRQVLAQDFQKRLADNQAQADRVFADIQSSKVDPNRLWNSQSTGGKVAASIGIILGGIGAGLTKGPNYALQTIDKAIDRDVEAQKIDLGKKENLLNHYMQQGNSLMASHQLAKADLLDVAAAQMQKTSAQYAGQKAAADAQIATGQLRQQAAALRQQATERELQIKQGQIGAQQQQTQMEAYRALMKGLSGGGGFNRQLLEMPGFDKYRERAVDLPDGSIALAPDKEEANKAREGFAAVSTLKAKLGRYSDLLKGGNPSTVDRGTAQGLRADILAEMGHLHGLNRLSGEDLALFEKQVPELSDLVKPMAAQKLRALGKSIDDRVWSLQQNYLSRPSGGRPNGG